MAANGKARTSLLYGPGIFDTITESLDEIYKHYVDLGRPDFVKLTRSEDGRAIFVNMRTLLVAREIGQ